MIYRLHSLERPQGDVFGGLKVKLLAHCRVILPGDCNQRPTTIVKGGYYAGCALTPVFDEMFGWILYTTVNELGRNSRHGCEIRDAILSTMFKL